LNHCAYFVQQGTLYGFPFTYVFDKHASEGRFLFDDENAGRFDIDEESEDAGQGKAPASSESIELLFPIQKNYYTQLDNKFISIQKSHAYGWCHGERGQVVGWHPMEQKLSGLVDEFAWLRSGHMIEEFRRTLTGILREFESLDLY
jgi:hypothetical protein